MNNSEVWGFDLDKAYNEYKKRLKGRIKHIENVGGLMYDGEGVYSKQEFHLHAIEELNKKDLLTATPSDVAKMVINYQSYGDFTYNQAEALQKHYNETHTDKISVKEARAKATEISNYYHDLIEKGVSIKQAKKEISWVFFGSK